jgi:hypothetical protein
MAMVAVMLAYSARSFRSLRNIGQNQIVPQAVRQAADLAVAMVDASQLPRKAQKLAQKTAQIVTVTFWADYPGDVRGLLWAGRFVLAGAR